MTAEPDTAPSVSPQPRALGGVEVETGADGLRRLRQSGCARLMMVRGRPLSGILVNTAGGLTGGDRISVDATAGVGATLRLTTQGAERVYRAESGTARIDTRLAAGPGARLDWLPQETILFDGSALQRRLEVDIAGDTVFTSVEALVFGRAAMGETVRRLCLRDDLRLVRDGTLIFADGIEMSGDAAAILGGAAIGAGAGAVASVLHAAPGAARHLGAIRADLTPTAGAGEVRPGLIFARILAADAFALRRTLVPILTRLTGALPRTWTL